jgi:hypothetical protein
MLFLKVYEEVEKHSPVQLTPYQKIFIVKELIDNGTYRHLNVEKIKKWFKNSNNRVDVKLRPVKIPVKFF